MDLLSAFEQEMQDLWRLLFPPTVLEDEDVLPMGVETSNQRILSLIEQEGSYRPIILNSRDFMPPITLGPAVLTSGLALRTLSLFTENQNKLPRSNGIRRSILEQLTLLRGVAPANSDGHLHRSKLNFAK